MAVDRDLILKLEMLSQLELSESERLSMQKDLEKMIQMIDKLNEINTEGLEPLIHLGNDHSLLRQDIIQNQLSRNDALENAEAHDNQYFLVPKVIEK
ncbi:MAG: Asp-tRNA(Asn)/Glu-tRNA(Gln) amidotransferase subunit GatC [Saprospiraceae bacterium]